MLGKQDRKSKYDDNRSNNGAKIIGFNFVEFDKQRRKEMLKKQHIQIEIVVTPNEEPYIQVKHTKISDDEIARMLVVLDIVKDDLATRCPSALLKAHFIKHETKTMEIYKKGDDDSNAKGKV